MGLQLFVHHGLLSKRKSSFCVLSAQCYWGCTCMHLLQQSVLAAFSSLCERSAQTHVPYMLCIRYTAAPKQQCLIQSEIGVQCLLVPSLHLSWPPYLPVGSQLCPYLTTLIPSCAPYLTLSKGPCSLVWPSEWHMPTGYADLQDPDVCLRYSHALVRPAL